MKQKIIRPPNSFELEAFASRWFHWEEIGPCFRPGRGGRSAVINPVLCPVQNLGGVYLIAWSLKAPKTFHPTHAAVLYVGETANFKRRMCQFGNSAGFFGPRCNGHSAAWRWPEGRHEHFWASFFEVEVPSLPHLSRGLRRWIEAVAQEEFRQVHSVLPQLNRVEEGELRSLELND
jgi:hypothetical protein